ncbi:MAG: C-terminal binding protein [Planctomycetota bacterium]|nr:C-terminal binding protein [Planctomycetota bacterium]
MTKVLITDYQWPDLDIESSLLGKAGIELVLPRGTTEAELAEAATGCAAIMTCWARTTERVIAAAPDCKIVARLGIGLDNINLDYCTRHRIPVTNVPDYCVIEVAEHALALLMALSRQVARFHLDTDRGIYDLSAAAPFRRIQGQTLGIVGLGNIGQYLAKIGQGIGMRVIGCSRSPKGLPGIQEVSFSELLCESDFISIHTPLTPETENLFDRKAFDKMKPTAFLVNTARGGIIDHRALADALHQNQIAGAALDVQSPEPPDLSTAPYNDPRVIVTPHAAFVSEESLADLRRRASQQVLDRLSGKTPESIVNGVVC